MHVDYKAREVRARQRLLENEVADPGAKRVVAQEEGGKRGVKEMELELELEGQARDLAATRIQNQEICMNLAHR